MVWETNVIVKESKAQVEVVHSLPDFSVNIHPLRLLCLDLRCAPQYSVAKSGFILPDGTMKWMMWFKVWQ